jgi:hypothetical protein
MRAVLELPAVCAHSCGACSVDRWEDACSDRSEQSNAERTACIAGEKRHTRIKHIRAH